MGLNLTSLAGKTATVDVDFMGQSTRVTYDPMVLTQENLLVSQASDEKFTDFFCQLVQSWDVMRSTKKVPITPEALGTVPLILLRAIYNAIMSDSGDDDSGKASNGG